MDTARLPDGLAVGPHNKAAWDQPAARRRGLMDLHRLHRYGLSFRAPRVLPLATCHDYRLHDLEPVRWYTSHPCFTGMIVLRGQRILLERYADDFQPSSPHSIQSITKTSVHLFAGRLVEEGRLDLAEPVVKRLPQVGPGYAHARLQDLFDMAVVNDYTEDFYDPDATVGLLEDAHGWRIMPARPHVDLREFLRGITGGGGADPARRLHYKTANTDVAAWVCELAAGRSLRDLYLDLVEACGAESTVHLSTDRTGVPFAGGGLHLTLRDFGRYGLLLARAGAGVDGHRVGGTSFREATRAQHRAGTPSLLGRGNYRNFCETDGHWLGHNGYGGQWLMVYPEEELVIGCLSALTDDGGLDWSYIARLAELGAQVAAQVLAQGGRG